ncbi:RDD family protein [Rugosimonospora africana]|uniref:RDD domain-containing protein n=1 Tax=Rugosimonospora africana TaxID=556532 RepID=A0A8J3VU21_9ACTN|nr:RDD family protein [Rugosimonospora africana]GIH18760.1 hypothetical protein Raf01_69320 [Rugosimonospora africana]
MTQSEPPAGSGEPRPAPGFPPPPNRPTVPQAGYLPPPPSPMPGYPPPGYGYPPPGYPLGGPVLPPGIAPNGQPLASFGDRLLAYLIDSAIIGGALLVVAVPAMIIVLMSSMHNLRLNADGTLDTGNVLSFYGLFFAVDGALLLLGVAAAYVYQVEMMYRSGQTVGKRAMKLRVVCLDPGAPMTRGVAAKRWLIGWVVGIIVGLFAWIDGLWQLWDQPFKQCLHDKVAGTVVVKQAP